MGFALHTTKQAERSMHRQQFAHILKRHSQNVMNNLAAVPPLANALRRSAGGASSYSTTKAVSSPAVVARLSLGLHSVSVQAWQHDLGSPLRRKSIAYNWNSITLRAISMPKAVPDASRPEVVKAREAIKQYEEKHPDRVVVYEHLGRVIRYDVIHAIWVVMWANQFTMCEKFAAEKVFGMGLESWYAVTGIEGLLLSAVLYFMAKSQALRIAAPNEPNPSRAWVTRTNLYFTQTEDEVPVSRIRGITRTNLDREFESTTAAKIRHSDIILRLTDRIVGYNLSLDALWMHLGLFSAIAKVDLYRFFLDCKAGGPFMVTQQTSSSPASTSTKSKKHK